MRRSNPVLSRLGEAARLERGVGYPPAPPQREYPGHQGYPTPVAPAGLQRAMTLDDVVTRTVMLVGLTTVTAAISWVTLHGGPLLALALGGSVIAGLVLCLVISFARITNPFVISLYAVLQGVLLGVVSREFERVYPGIVVQAVVGTFGVFLGMAALYKSKVIRATPKFTRFVLGALFGVVALSMINWVLAMFGHNLGYEYYAPTEKAGTLAILFSLACIVIGALTFILDFEMVAQGIRYGLPERFAWYCAFGMLVGLIYLYWQILRLLGYLRR